MFHVSLTRGQRCRSVLPVCYGDSIVDFILGEFGCKQSPPERTVKRKPANLLNACRCTSGEWT